MAKTWTFASATEVAARAIVGVLALLMVVAMALHLIDGTYREYYWYVVAYLAVAIPASVGLLWPGTRPRVRWSLAAPFVFMTFAGLMEAWG